MAHSGTGWLRDAILAAPAGVALLVQLEDEQRQWSAPSGPLAEADPDAVAGAVRSMATTSFGTLVSGAVHAVEHFAGPWVSGAPSHVAHACRLAEQRRPIAEAIVERFGSLLAMPLDRGAQQWWHSNHASEGYFAEARFRDFSEVYGTGQFPWAGFWTASDRPPEVHDELVSAWELSPGPISRWHMPVRPDARVWEVHSPTDWARLVLAYPKVATKAHQSWELPGPNQHRRDLADLLGVAGQRAARATVKRQLVPDWDAVAKDYDGVHLSWAGLLTTEGYVSDLPDGSVTMLRYWWSERTLWLADVFGSPVPAPAPVLSGCVSNYLGADLSSDVQRRNADLEVLRALLGRSPANK